VESVQFSLSCGAWSCLSHPMLKIRPFWGPNWISKKSLRLLLWWGRTPITVLCHPCTMAIPTVAALLGLTESQPAHAEPKPSASLWGELRTSHSSLIYNPIPWKSQVPQGPLPPIPASLPTAVSLDSIFLHYSPQKMPSHRKSRSMESHLLWTHTPEDCNPSLVMSKA
jgi:hypothetical protein